jgi:hypothetical protein
MGLQAAADVAREKKRQICQLFPARRHLNEAQRANVAANLANLKDGQRADKLSRSANLQSFVPVSQSDAAKRLNVSTRSVARAAKQTH